MTQPQSIENAVEQLQLENANLQTMLQVRRATELGFRTTALATHGAALENAQWSVKLLMRNLSHEHKEMFVKWLQYALDAATRVRDKSKTDLLTAEAEQYRTDQAAGKLPPRPLTHLRASAQREPTVPKISFEEIDL